MPSGAKKRKAAKKKLQKGGHNTTTNNGSHSQGTDDLVSHVERESDGGEVERESSEERVVDNHEEGAGEVSLREGNAAEFAREVKPDEGFNDVTVNDDDVARETHNGDHKSSSSSSSDDDEVTVEKEKLVATEVGEVEQQGKDSLSETVLHDQILKPTDYMSGEASGKNSVISKVVYNSLEESIPVEESVKQVVSVPLESNTVSESIPIENSTTSGVIESGLNQNADEVLPPSDEKNKMSSTVTDLVQDEIETKVIPVVGEGPGNPSLPVDITARDVEGLLPKSSGVTSMDVCCGDNHVKESEPHKHVEEQPLVSSAPLPVRRTSWMDCCGLFEVFSGGSSR